MRSTTCRENKARTEELEVLTLLVRRQGALVSREEIVHEIWGDAVHIDADAGINTALRKIRIALDCSVAPLGQLVHDVGLPEWLS